jgi:hypothetical protein
MRLLRQRAYSEEQDRQRKAAESVLPRSVDACPDEDFNPEAKTEIARLQLTDHLAGLEIACAKCRLVRSMHAYYRCRWCSVWYCWTCAAAHFGADSKHLPEGTSNQTKP